MKFEKNKIPIYLIIVFGIINTLLNGDLVVPNVFVTLGGLYLLLKTDENLRKNMYYITLVLALTGYNLKLDLNGRIGIYYFAITLFIYILVLIYDLYKKNIKFNVKRFKNQYFIFLVVFIAYGVLSFFWSIDKKDAFIGIYNYAIMICFLLMFIIENSNMDNLRKTMKVLLVLFCGILAVGLIEILGYDIGIRNTFIDQGLYFTDPISAYMNRVPSSFYYNPNTYSFVLGVAIVLVMGKLMYSKDNKEKLILGSILMVSIVELIFAQSRTVWITVGIVLIAMVIIALITRDKKVGVKAVVFLIVYFLIINLVGMIPFMKPYYGKINRTPILNEVNIGATKEETEWLESTEKGGTSSMSKRATIVDNIYKGVIKEKNYFGFGVNNTSNYILAQNNTYGVVSVHCLWLEILGDFGILILLYFVYICISMFVKLLMLSIKFKENRESYTMAMMACIGVAFFVFSPSTVVAFIPFWITMGVIYLMCSNEQ